MPAEHDQAQCQRGRDDQPDRAPYPSPEDRGDNYSNRRQACAVTVDERLNALPHDSAVTTESTAGQTAIDQPGSTAAASTIGSAAAIHDPTYGTKRNSAPRMPHSSGLGTPMK